MEYKGPNGDTWYMIRNFMTGDEEQTRIEDSDYTANLPPNIREAIKLLVAEAKICATGGHDHYNEAIAIFVRNSFSPLAAWAPLEADAREWSEMWVGDTYDPTEVEVNEEVQNLLEELKAGFEQLTGW